MATERNFGLMRGYKRDGVETGSERPGVDIFSKSQHEARGGDQDALEDKDTEEAMLMRRY